MHVTRKLVQDYYAARLSRDPARIAPFLDDDIQWSIVGPVNLMHFCGERRGKQAVIDAIVRHVPAQLEVTAMELEEIVIDGDRVATFSRLTARHSGTGRTVTYRCANFLQFRDNRIVRFHGLMDSFDAAEQILGHRINVAGAGDAAPCGARRNVVVV
jgi:ketosteroid isomerase-like protein